MLGTTGRWRIELGLRRSLKNMFCTSLKRVYNFGGHYLSCLFVCLFVFNRDEKLAGSCCFHGGFVCEHIFACLGALDFSSVCVSWI